MNRKDKEKEYWDKVERKQRREEYLPYLGGILTLVFYYLLKWIIG